LFISLLTADTSWTQTRMQHTAGSTYATQTRNIELKGKH